MRNLLAISIACGLLAACHGDSTSTVGADARSAVAHPHSQGAVRKASGIASLADHGSLVAYEGAPVQRGATTWRDVQISEAHALRAAVAGGALTLPAPDGSTMKVGFVRRVEHADGNWSYVGRAEGAPVGKETVLTFGDKAVFGTIPYKKGAPLQITTIGDRTFMVESDPNKAIALGIKDPTGADSINLPAEATAFANDMRPRVSAAMASRTSAAGAQSLVASRAPITTSTVDIVVGYTAGFATRLGGTSQAVTRLRFLVDTTNLALANSKVGGSLRASQFIQVDFPDETNNRETLFQLTGVSCTNRSNTGELPDSGVTCTSAARPAALEPLALAREQFGADLVTLVRAFDNDTNGSCGIGWKLGGGQTPINAASAAFGYSVVSDSSGTIFTDGGANCRDDNLAHEVGHNLGLQHDVATAAGSDDTNGDTNLLDPEEYGRLADSFGYFAAPEAGDFFDTMAVRRPGKDNFLIYSNPSVADCNGFACGVANEANAARTLNLTIPQVAAFRKSVVPTVGNWYRGDFDGDGKSDLLWRNLTSGSNVVWRGAVSQQSMSIKGVASMVWQIASTADFDGNGKSDIVWRNSTSGQNLLWRDGQSTLQGTLGSPPAPWGIVGAGDFNGDGKADLLWRNGGTGGNVYWRGAVNTQATSLRALADLDWVVAAIGDFNGDGKSDILWRHSTTRAAQIWLSGNGATTQGVTAWAAQWTVMGAGDFNGDGKADILLRNLATGQNVIWRSGNSATPQGMAVQPNLDSVPVAIGDFNNDGKDDVMWRNVVNGQNVIWLSANANTVMNLTTTLTPTWLQAG